MSFAGRGLARASSWWFLGTLVYVLAVAFLIHVVHQEPWTPTELAITVGTAIAGLVVSFAVILAWLEVKRWVMSMDREVDR